MNKEKFFTKDIIICIIILTVILGGDFLLPNSGDLVLLDEIFDVSVIVIILGYVIYRLFKVIKKNAGYKKIIVIMLIILCFGICIYFSKNIVLDIINGPTEIELYDYMVSKKMTNRIVETKYYINGKDEYSNKHIMEISEDDANRISAKYSSYVTIVYYKNTKRVIKIY